LFVENFIFSFFSFSFSTKQLFYPQALFNVCHISEFAAKDTLTDPILLDFRLAQHAGLFDQPTSYPPKILGKTVHASPSRCNKRSKTV